MRKSLFAGITVLNPDESVTTDNGAFIGRDRDTIDRFLELGAKTHRHTGLPGLSNPTLPMGASAIASGGTIRAGQTFTLAYAVEDFDGGETLVGPPVTFSTVGTIEAPSDALVGEAKYEEGGDLQVDTYYYAFSFIDGEGGETPIGPAVAVERSPGFEEASILLSGFAAPLASATGATGWRLYRAVGGGDFGYLSSGSGDTFLDNGSLTANCDLPPLEEGTNSTNGASAFEVALPAVVEGEFINVYMTNSGEFVGDVLLEQFPVSSAGKKALYRNLELQPGQPPDVNQSVGTASQIDPDTELLDWHWKRPKANPAALPSGNKGDVRLVYSNKTLYGVFASSAFGPADWEPIAGGGGSSGVRAEDGVNVVDPAAILEFVSSGGASVGVDEPEEGKARITIAAEGEGGGSGKIFVEGGEFSELFDDFTTDTIASGLWAGEPKDAEIVGGKLVLPTPSDRVRIRRTDATLDPGAAEQRFVAHVTVADALGDVEIMASYKDPENFLACVFDPSNGLADTFTIQKVVGGEFTSLKFGGGNVIPEGGDVWLEVIVKGEKVTQNVYTADPDAGEPAAVFTQNKDMTADGDKALFFNIANEFGVGMNGNKEGDAILSFRAEGILGGTSLEADTIEFRTSGLGLTVEEDPEDPNHAIVTYSGEGGGPGEAEPQIFDERIWASATVGPIASGGTSAVSFDLDPDVLGAALLKISTNKRARVRAYGDAAARTADLSRGIGTDPTGDHGLLLDYANTTAAGGGKRRITPIVDAHNLDEPADDKLYLSVTNFEATNSVTVAFLYVPNERTG